MMIKVFKITLVFLILILWYSCAEFRHADQLVHQKENQTSEFCPKIYGKWEACNAYSQSYPKKKKPIIYTFDINGGLTVDDYTFPYRLEQNCSKLFINNESTYSSVELRKDTLFISSNSYYGEYDFTLKLKKLN